MSLLRVFLALCNMTWWFGVFFKKKEKIFFLVRMTEIKHDKQIYHCLNMVYISYLSTHCTLIYLSRSPRGLGKQGNSGKISKGTREHESIFREQRNITVQIRRRKHFDIRNKEGYFWDFIYGHLCTTVIGFVYFTQEVTRTQTKSRLTAGSLGTRLRGSQVGGNLLLQIAKMANFWKCTYF